MLNLNDGIQVDQIASLKPDLIVATNAGLDQDTYTKLSAIAPTIAQSGPDAFFEPWKDQATAIGQAVFKADEMATLIAGVDEKFADVGKNNPQFAGKKVLLLGGTFYQDSVRVTTPGWRTDFLTNMGFTIPDTGGELVPRDKMASVLDGADVLIWTTESDDEQAALLADPIVAKLRATIAEAQCLHRQGSRRCDRVRVDAVLPGGGRPAAANARPGAGLTRYPGDQRPDRHQRAACRVRSGRVDLLSDLRRGLHRAGDHLQRDRDEGRRVRPRSSPTAGSSSSRSPT